MIDVCVVVQSSRDVPACIEGLALIGDVHRGNLGVPDREAFRRPNGLPGHHLYVSPRESLSLICVLAEAGLSEEECAEIRRINRVNKVGRPDKALSAARLGKR